MAAAKYEVVVWGEGGGEGSYNWGEIFLGGGREWANFWLLGGHMLDIQDICQILPKYVQKLTL